MQSLLEHLCSTITTYLETEGFGSECSLDMGWDILWQNDPPIPVAIAIIQAPVDIGVYHMNVLVIGIGEARNDEVLKKKVREFAHSFAAAKAEAAQNARMN